MLHYNFMSETCTDHFELIKVGEIDRSDHWLSGAGAIL